MTHTPITVDELRKLLEINASGVLVWKARTKESFKLLNLNWWNQQNAGKPALTAVTSEGYLRGRILGSSYLAHRVVWALHYGEWPKHSIDHINGDKADNSIGNLRDVSTQENARNAKLSAANKVGKVGVSYHKNNKNFSSRIVVDGKQIHLGSFKSIEDAAKARAEAERKYGFHQNHGKKPAELSKWEASK